MTELGVQIYQLSQCCVRDEGLYIWGKKPNNSATNKILGCVVSPLVLSDPEEMTLFPRAKFGNDMKERSDIGAGDGTSELETGHLSWRRVIRAGDRTSELGTWRQDVRAGDVETVRESREI